MGLPLQLLWKILFESTKLDLILLVFELFHNSQVITILPYRELTIVQVSLSQNVYCFYNM